MAAGWEDPAVYIARPDTVDLIRELRAMGANILLDGHDLNWSCPKASFTHRFLRKIKAQKAELKQLYGLFEEQMEYRTLH